MNRQSGLVRGLLLLLVWVGLWGACAAQAIVPAGVTCVRLYHITITNGAGKPGFEFRAHMP